MNLLRWLLENGNADAYKYLGDLDYIKVVSRCACGCPSVNFTADQRDGISILADFVFDDPDGGLSGVFAFNCKTGLGGIDVWSIDGIANPKQVPDPEMLRPYGPR
jgi:hypothetical protein